MALASAAWGHDGKSYNGKDMRQLLEAIFPTPAGGVISGLAVTQEASPTSTVSIAAGKAVVAATGASLTGDYHVWNDAATSSPSIDPTTTNGRKDRLIVRVTSGVPAFEIVKGTAAASPAEPAITGDNYLELALITLPGSTSNVTNAMITDRRVFTSATRAPIVCTSSTRPTGIIEGQVIYETDTDRIAVYDGSAWVQRGNIAIGTSASRPTAFDGLVMYETDRDSLAAYDGSVWAQVGPLSQWSAWSPTMTQSGSVTFTNSYGRYMRIGRTIIAQCRLSVTGSGTSGQRLYLSLPADRAYTGAEQILGNFRYTDTSSGAVYRGDVFGTASAQTVCFQHMQSGNFLGDGEVFGAASGDLVTVSVTYEAAA